MNKFILATSMLLILMTSANTQENICKGGKLSKEFLSCKAKNLKGIIVRTDENLKKSIDKKFKILKKNSKEVSGNLTNKVKEKIN